MGSTQVILAGFKILGGVQTGDLGLVQAVCVEFNVSGAVQTGGVKQAVLVKLRI
jgi:hypothetical protein